MEKIKVFFRALLSFFARPFIKGKEKREALLRLSRISLCDSTVFSLFDGYENALSAVEKAENNDEKALLDLLSRMTEPGKPKTVSEKTLNYFADKAIGAKAFPAVYRYFLYLSETANGCPDTVKTATSLSRFLLRHTEDSQPEIYEKASAYYEKYGNTYGIGDDFSALSLKKQPNGYLSKVGENRLSAVLMLGASQKIGDTVWKFTLGLPEGISAVGAISHDSGIIALKENATLRSDTGDAQYTDSTLTLADMYCFATLGSTRYRISLRTAVSVPFSELHSESRYSLSRPAEIYPGTLRLLTDAADAGIHNYLTFTLSLHKKPCTEVKDPILPYVV